MLADIQMRNRRFLFVLWFPNIMWIFCDGRGVFLFASVICTSLTKILSLKKKKVETKMTLIETRELGSSPASIVSCIMQDNSLISPGSFSSSLTSCTVLGVEWRHDWLWETKAGRMMEDREPIGGGITLSLANKAGPLHSETKKCHEKI